MAYVTITTPEITTGEPTSTTLFTKIKDDLDDHEDRIGDLETTTLVQRPFVFYVRGKYQQFTIPLNQICFQDVTFDLTLTSAKLRLLDAGTSGSLEVDVLFKRGVSAFASIFSVKPILGFASSQFATNSGTLSTTALLTGDILALSITQSMAGNTEFEVVLEYTI